MGQEKVRIQLGTWSELRALAAPIRFEVFVQEQNVPLELELDEMDAQSLHALAFDLDGMVLATGRLLPDGHIGRMAVRKSSRQQGVGAQVLSALIAAAVSKGYSEVLLGAQLHARDFYVKQGFVEFGEVFMDANIPHVMMRKALV